MQKRFGVLTPKALFLAIIVSLGACDKSDAQTVTLPEKLTVPTFGAAPINDKAKNLDVAVTATDGAGRSPGQKGFSGASLGGECRVYLNNVTPVVSDELYDRAFRHLDKVVQDAGSIEFFVKNPDMVPAAHIWADVNAPWRCVAGAIYNVQMGGFPTIGFIMQRNRPSSIEASSEVQVLYVDLPAPRVPDKPDRIEPITNKIVVTAKNTILWNGEIVSAEKFLSNLEKARSLPLEPSTEFEPEPDASYGFVAQVLLAIPKFAGSELDFVNAEKHRLFGKDESGVDPVGRSR